MVSKDRRADNKQQLHSTSVDDRRRDLHGDRRVRLLSGTSYLTLSLAWMMVALGVCVPGDARAQTTVNPVQNTVFTLDPAQNPITFDATTNITITGSTAPLQFPAAAPLGT